MLRELGEVNASLQAECWGLPPEWRGAVEHVRREPSSIIQHIYIYIVIYYVIMIDYTIRGISKANTGGRLVEFR